MSDEIRHNYFSGETLYACRFDTDGTVFLTDGSSSEAWGTGASDADTYDVALTEDGSGGHYVGDFDASGNIAAGVYQVAIYLQAGANPADSDVCIGQGEISWDGTAEVTELGISGEQAKAVNVYGPGE